MIPNAITSFAGFVTTISTIGLVVAHILIALGIYRDASERKINGKKVKLLSPNFWGWISLFISFPMLALYWVAHYSTFIKESE